MEITFFVEILKWLHSLNDWIMVYFHHKKVLAIKAVERVNLSLNSCFFPQVMHK